MLNKKCYIAYSLVFIMSLECCGVCTVSNDIKTISIKSEELIRRRKVIENYLSKESHSENDWIETYHMVLPKNVISTDRNTKESYTSLGGQEISSKGPIRKSFELSSQEYFQETDDSVEANSLFFSGDNSQFQSVQSGILDPAVSEFNEIPTEEITSSSSILKTFKPEHFNLQAFERGSELQLRNMKGESLSIVKQSKAIRHLVVNELENFLNKDIDNKEFVSKEKEIRREFMKGECRLVENQYFPNEKNIAHNKPFQTMDSVCKPKTLFKEVLKSLEFCKASDLKGDIKINDFTKKIYIEKTSNTLTKREGDLSNNNIPSPKNFQNSDLELSTGSELLYRKQFVSSYISTLHDNQWNWVETYNCKEGCSSENFNVKSIIDDSIEQNSITRKNPKLNSQEKYPIRWINKLRKKFDEYFFTSRHSINTLSIPLSVDILNSLEELTKASDIVNLDVLISSLISNATQHISYANTFDFKFLPVEFNLVNILVVVSLIFLYYSNISIYFKLFVTALVWHGYKLYHEKIAERHNILSRVPSSYCDNILDRESGFFAHIKEYYRHYWYGEDCQKLYDATMVDPLSEISLPIILADLVADSFSQLFKPFGRKLNNFFKDLTYDLSYLQQISIFGLLIIILMFCLLFFAVGQKYRISFPFLLGSVEPTKFSAGSKVEDIAFDNDQYFLQNNPANCCTQLESKNSSSKFNSKENRIEMETNILHITKQTFSSSLSPEMLHYRPRKGRRESI